MMKAYTKQQIGRKGEHVAAKFLRRDGYRVLTRNQRFGKNELDLVVKDKQYIVFVEVKTRSLEGAEEIFYRPADAVDHKKRKRTIAAAIDYLKNHKQTP